MILDLEQWKECLGKHHENGAHGLFSVQDERKRREQRLMNSSSSCIISYNHHQTNPNNSIEHYNDGEVLFILSNLSRFRMNFKTWTRGLARCCLNETKNISA